jgi:putative alpha-1,2-mannosidase
MKKLLALSLLASAFALGGATDTASANPVNSTVVRVSTSAYNAASAQRWNRRQGRVRFVTRTVRQGRHLYRVTYRIAMFPNGRTSSQIVRRVMIR